MAELVLEGKTARSLSALGGRNLVKTGEILAGSIVESMKDFSVVSNGKEITLSNEREKLLIKPEQGEPVFREKYYLYQKGSIVLESNKRLLEKTKQLLIKLASERKNYILERYDSKHLEEYGLSMDFVLDLQKTVNELEVKE